MKTPAKLSTVQKKKNKTKPLKPFCLESVSRTLCIITVNWNLKNGDVML